MDTCKTVKYPYQVCTLYLQMQLRI